MANLIHEILTKPGLEQEAERRLGNLPENIIAAERIYLGPETNVFINDEPGIDSFGFLMRLLPKNMPYVPLLGEPRRGLEIWDAAYLTERLVDVLLTLEDIGDRVIVPMSGCGVTTAINLARELNKRGVNLQIKPLEEVGSQPVVVVDDIAKTTNTMSRFLPKGILENEGTVYAVSAMAGLTEEDYRLDPIYDSLRYLTKRGQRIFTGVAYAGSGTSNLGLPVNSISTLLGNDNKAAVVLAALAKRYFGVRIYNALNLEP